MKRRGLEPTPPKDVPACLMLMPRRYRAQLDHNADQGVQQTDFNILVEYLQLAMDHEKVAFRAQNRLLGKLAPMQKDVVSADFPGARRAVR